MPRCSTIVLDGGVGWILDEGERLDEPGRVRHEPQLRFGNRRAENEHHSGDDPSPEWTHHELLPLPAATAAQNGVSRFPI